MKDRIAPDELRCAAINYAYRAGDARARRGHRCRRRALPKSGLCAHHLAWATGNARPPHRLLTAEQVREMRAWWERLRLQLGIDPADWPLRSRLGRDFGVPRYEDIAARYGVAGSVIWRVLHGQTYAEIQPAREEAPRWDDEA